MDQTSHHRLTLANRITIVRILCVPLFVLMLLYYTMGLKSGAANEMHRIAALVLFVAAALTDAIDGYFARSRNEITNLGRILDPIADKSLLLAGLILLTRPSIAELTPHVPIWFTLLVVSRDAVLILGAMLIHHVSGAVEIRPRRIGKVATVFQMLTVLWVLTRASKPFTVTVAAAGALTFVSGAIYILDGVRQLEKAAVEHKHPHTVPHA